MSDDFIYHYTKQDGLKGILESQCLWATHCSALNDKTELNHFFDILRSYRNRLPSPSRKNFCDALQNIIPSESSGLKIDYYITCFSSDGNNAYMWDKEKSDVAIVFSKNALNALVQKEANFFMGIDTLAPVLYGLSEKVEWLKAIQKRFWSSYAARIHDQILADTLISIAALFKNPIPWEAQKEWRIIVKVASTIDGSQFPQRPPKTIHPHGNFSRIHLFNDPQTPNFSGLTNAIRDIIPSPDGGNDEFVKDIKQRYSIR